MNKLIITPVDGRILTALLENSRVIQMDLEEEDASILGNIYVGKVKNIAKNINSAFVEFADRQMAYYSLSDNRVHNFTSPGHQGSLKAGDEIIIQISRDAVKSKDPVATAKISFAGRYCVLTCGKTQITCSSKIGSQPWKEMIRQRLLPYMEDGFGVIVRTNAWDVSPETIVEELEVLKAQFHKVMEEGRYRTSKSLIFRSVPPCVARLRDTYSHNMEEILTDDPVIFSQLKEYLTVHQKEDLSKLRLYTDTMVSLSNVYQLEKAMEEALSRHVWLRSGGYLVIDPTESMTVIDVNTGKYSGKKNLHDTIMKINLEAAEEISRQLRLRNLSGIIVADFIDMELEEDRKLLLKTLSAYCLQDPVKTTVVDITKLNLVEITRKKIRKPLYEQIKEKNRKERETERK